MKSLDLAQVLTEADVWDVPFIVETLEFSAERDELWWLLGAALSLRYYNSQPSMDLLKHCFLGKSRNKWPDFGVLENAVAAAHRRAKGASSSEPKLHGGLFRATLLTEYSADGGLTWKAAPRDGVKRDVLGLRLMWQALPRAAWRCYQENPTRDGFKAALLQFQENLASVQKSMFGDYMVKGALDVAVVSRAITPGTISAWPLRCPAFVKALPVFYPGIGRELWFLAFCHWHQFIGVSRNLSFPCALSQLCWDHRRRSGVLRDEM